MVGECGGVTLDLTGGGGIGRNIGTKEGGTELIRFLLRRQRLNCLETVVMATGGNLTP